MAIVFTITRGLPWPLALGALEMLAYAAGGGEFGMANDKDHSLMVVLDNADLIANFRTYLNRLATVQFTESDDVPPVLFETCIIRPVAY